MPKDFFSAHNLGSDWLDLSEDLRRGTPTAVFGVSAPHRALIAAACFTGKTVYVCDNAQTAAAKFFVPKRLLGRELTPEQQEKFGKMETIYVTGMKDRDGQPFNAYVRMNLDRGKPDFFRYNPDKAKSQAREITPTADHKTQVAVNNGATDEATRRVQRPLKPAAAQPAQVEAAKQEGKKEMKKKSGKGRKL